MKTNYLFKARWLQGAASANESKKMQVNPRKSLLKEGLSKDESSTRYRLVIDSLSTRYRVWQYSLGKIAAVVCMLLTLSIGNAWGATATFTPSSRNAGTLSGAPTGATATYYNSYNNANQITGGNTATLTLSGFDGCTISGLSLNLRKSSGTKTAGITASVNNSQFIDYTVASSSLSTTAKDFTITLSSNPEVGTGNSIEIVITPSASSIYIFSYTITYTAATPKTVLFNTGAGNPSVSSRTEASGGAGITLPSSSDLTPACSGDGWVLYGWATAAYGSSSTTTAPSATLAGLAGATYKPATNNVTLYAVYKKTTGDPVARTLSATYASHTGWTESDNMCNNGYWVLCTGGTLTSPELVDLSTVTSITFNARTYGGSSYNTVNVKTSGGTSVGSATAGSTSMVSKTVSVSGLSGSGSFVFSSSTTTASYGPGMNNVVINYSEAPALYWSAPTCAACSSNASIGNATLNGSVSLSSVPFSCTVSSEGGTGCSISDAGFVWKSGSDPSASDNKTAGTFSTNITGTIPSAGSFSLGTTYYVKAYATNGNGTVLSGTSYQYRVQSVTYNGNTSTSGSMNTQYVEYNKSTALTSNAFSKTGHTFAGWATAADGNVVYSNGQSVSATGNLSLYAKWTANNYTITLDKDLTPTTAGTTSITATYNSSSNLTSAITKPTKDGWTFAGYFTAKNGGGTQIIDANGNVIASAGGGSTYTDASKNWKYVGNITLYAKWTCTATWSVNGNTSVYAAQTITYNSSGCKVSSVPAPDPASYCGQSFAGWTTSAINRPQDSAPATLFKTVGDSPELKTVGNQTFYAVFADYDE